MNADEESRSRQYDGTARENDEVSKATKFRFLAYLPKTTYIKAYHQNLLYF